MVEFKWLRSKILNGGIIEYDVVDFIMKCAHMVVVGAAGVQGCW